jgi:LuxR family transcriptional regulator, maltose regulon positive regulatory protein
MERKSGDDLTVDRAPPFDVVESKLHPPVPRRGIVARTALVDRLVAAQAAPIVAIVAPAGYGKTTVLAQWAERKRPRVAWVSCEDGDNDPAVLLAHLAVALARIEPIDPSVLRILTSGGGVTVVARFVTAAAATHAPVALALDHAEAITKAECRDTIAELALSLPPGWQLALTSRHAVPLPLSRLRVQGAIVEIGTRELAMSPTEAAALLEGVGLRLAETSTRDIVQRTEGWPTGLYLAALALRAGAVQRVELTPAGDDGYLSDYLRSELLERTSPAERSFLTRTSVLDRLTGPLCDATLATTGSAQTLEELESRNLLVVPLDRRREWYRYHHLFRDLLRAELTRHEPDLVRQLHTRAAAWFEANGMPEAAIEHAQAGGDAGRVARLVLEHAQPVWATGRVDTVLRWMQWFEREDALERFPAVAVHGALIFALVGEPDEAERWAAVARRASGSGTLPDGSTMESLLAYLRALLAADGVEAMRRDARASLDGLSPISPFRATMMHTEGLSYLIEGDPVRADRMLATALVDAVDDGALPLAALLLAERCVIAIDRRDWPEAEALADRAVSIVRDGHFEHYWTSALVYAAAAEVARHRGDLRAARESAARAARLRPLLVYVLPVVSVQALLALARAYIGLGDAGGADAALQQVHDILQRRPDLGLLPAQAEQLRARLDTLAGEVGGASSLTAAELRLLPLLSTHLSLREIGERLKVTRHTVKSQADSIYRKLGVSSRSDAIDRIRELGMPVR